LQRFSHWYVKVNFQQAAKSSEHVGARRVASKKIPTHNASAERTALVISAMSRHIHVGRCGVVDSTLAFGFIGSNLSTAYFHIMVHQPSAS